MNVRITCLIALIAAGGLLSACGGTVKVAKGTRDDVIAQPLAASGKGTVERLASNRFRTRCADFEGAAVQQQEPVWCWAACAEMILRYKGATFDGKPVDQAEIAARIQGRAPDGSPKAINAAGHREIMLALNPDVKDRYDELPSRVVRSFVTGGSVSFDGGSLIDSFTDRWSVNTDDLVRDVSRGEPVVMGLSKAPNANFGHVVVVYGVTYAVEPESALARSLNQAILGNQPEEYGIVEIEAIDPWNGKPFTLTAEAMQADVEFMISQKRARSVLDKEMTAIQAREGR
jgi:hypothetical protein